MTHRLDTFAERRDLPTPERKIAIIDMGSNSFRLIVMEYIPHLSFKLVDEVRDVVRLSEGMEETGIIRASAMERAMRAAHLYGAFCKASGITEIVAAGTSAIRDATNSDRLLKRIETETGLKVRVLSGEEEAYYGYLAAVNSTRIEDGFVIDLGGGSLQIMRVKGRRLQEHVSFPLGAVRVSEKFLRDDPPKAKDIEHLQAHLQQKFMALDWFNAIESPVLIGLGGTLRQIGRLVQKMTHYPLDELHGYVYTREQLDTIGKDLASKTVAERKKISGMKADRADIALGGALVIYEVMRAGGFDALTVCGQSMREGLFYEKFLGDLGDFPPIFDHVRRASVVNLAHVYRFQEQHSLHIAHLTRSMYDQLGDYMQCGEEERDLLWAASMLHDIGTTIDYNDHHKHGAYLIMNAGLPGYSHREITLITLMTRYHRKGSPDAHELASILKEGDTECLMRLCALLRLAEFLDRARDGSVRDVRLLPGNGWVQMELHVQGDTHIAVWAVEQQKDFFKEAFGLELEVVAVSV